LRPSTARWPLRARRTVFVFFHCLDGVVPDLEAFLRGEARVARTSQIHAVAPLVGEERPISDDELELALSIPSDDWVEVADADRDRVRALAHNGVLVTDAEDETLAALRARDEALASAGWNLYGAVHYLMTKWSGVDLRASPDEGEFPPITKETIAEFVALRGQPPDPFHALAEPLAVQELPLVRGRGELYDTLGRRKTTRGFDRGQRMAVDELAIVLYEVWGCHGTAPVLGDIFCLKRTSPSGGSMHPIEVYPLVTGVDGVEPGVYHYNGRDHALELIERLGEDDAVALAADFTCGQNYFGSAHVSFVMTARFPRNYWKYPAQQKAYPVVLMDAAHLSQTHYLVATELGLGAYVTVAVNARDIEARLGLDGVTEGVVAMAGCGKQRPQGSPFEPRYEPYVPRQTQL
jgi:putative peptide maturation dehydrogenase